MKINQQMKYLILSFLFFVLACASFWFLLGRINENKKLSDEAEIAWQTESTRRYDLNSLERSLKDVVKEVSMLQSHFVRTDDIVSFLNQIEYLGSLVGVKATIESVNSRDGDTGKVLTLGVKTVGSFSATYKFLMLLENSQYEVEVTEVNLNRQDAISSSIPNPVWGGNFSIDVLSFVP